LPFLLATTLWHSGQALFTLLILAMALLSILDPLYYRLAGRLRWLYFAFHAQCVFLVVLVTLPTLLQLTTGQSLLLAIGAMMLFSLPSLLHLLGPMRPARWLAVLVVLPLLAGMAWAGRAWVPPASLWLSGSALSPAFDSEARHPRGSMRLTPEALSRQGLFAFTAIHAPRGLREEVMHVWRHNGDEIDRIALEIEGGREAGYRAWSHKQNFPEDAQGAWRIDVMTDGGQRIGMLHFTVSDDAETATLADGTIQRPSGITGLDVRRRLPEPVAEPTGEHQSAQPTRPAATKGHGSGGQATPPEGEAGAEADDPGSAEREQR